MVCEKLRRNVFDFTAEPDDLYYLYYRWLRKKREPRNPFIPMRLTTMTLVEFPPFLLKECSDPSGFIAAYILRLIREQRADSGSCMLMPSMSRLAKFFDMPQMEIENAFWKLRKQGYDCMIPGEHGQITMSVQPLSPKALKPIANASF